MKVLFKPYAPQYVQFNPYKNQSFQMSFIVFTNVSVENEKNLMTTFSEWHCGGGDSLGVRRVGSSLCARSFSEQAYKRGIG